MNPILSILSKIIRRAIDATNNAFDFASQYGDRAIGMASNAMRMSNPYMQAASVLAPVGKFLYGAAFGNKGKKPITMGNYTDAIQEFQNQDLDFSSSLSRRQFDQRATESDKDLKDLQNIINMANEDYSTASKQDTFRGNY